MPKTIKPPAAFNPEEPSLNDVNDLFDVLSYIFHRYDDYDDLSGNAEKQTQKRKLLSWLVEQAHKDVESAAHLGLFKLVRRHKLSVPEMTVLFYLGYLGVFKSSRCAMHKIVALLQKLEVGRALENLQMLRDKKSPLLKNRLIEAIADELRISDKALSIMTEQIIASPSVRRQKIAPKLPPTAASIYTALGKYVIGQNAPKKTLATAVFEHLIKTELSARNNKIYHRNNVLLIGPTGSGKTYMCETLAKILKLPVFIFDMTQYTETGYVGQDIQDILGTIQRQTNTDGYVLPCSIAVLDEIDKLASIRPGPGHYSTRDVSGKSVQEELLRLVESVTYNIEHGKFMGMRTTKTYNTHNVLFIAAGAFFGLADIIARRLNQHAIGFNSGSGDAAPAIDASQVTTEDLIEYGMMPELVGRFPSVAVLDPLNKQDLIQILTRSKNNSVMQYQEVLRYCGTNMEFSTKMLEELAEEALVKGTGARGLSATLAALASSILFEKGRLKKQ